VIVGTCDRGEPALVELAPGQAASCFLYPQP
jgi:hypothetical protein